MTQVVSSPDHDVSAVLERQERRKVAAGLYERGEEALFGMGHTAKDFDEAREYFEDAAKLGYGRAFWRLGWMRMLGQGLPASALGATAIWEAGVERQDRFCWGELACRRAIAGDAGGAVVAWQSFFQSTELFAEEEEIDLGWLVCRYLECWKAFRLEPLMVESVGCFATEARRAAVEMIRGYEAKLGREQAARDPTWRLATNALLVLGELFSAKRGS
ncbi:MAG: sel1 repeat family protein [Phycisphaerales bacterium]|nr:sel1 repeat family protein [Phycisphaerales bacterium]